jgi:hypothetical protein
MVQEVQGSSSAIQAEPLEGRGAGSHESKALSFLGTSENSVLSVDSGMGRPWGIVGCNLTVASAPASPPRPRVPVSAPFSQRAAGQHLTCVPGQLPEYCLCSFVDFLCLSS